MDTNIFYCGLGGICMDTDQLPLDCCRNYFQLYTYHVQLLVDNHIHHAAAVVAVLVLKAKMVLQWAWVWD